MTAGSRHAKSVAKSTTRKKITIGAAARIRATTVARCGGAAVRQAKRLLVVSMALTSQRMMTRMKRKLRTLHRTKRKAANMFAALAARKLAIRYRIALETQI